jgi:hypothetical protein
MREFRRPAAFDGAINHASLREGAQLALDMVGKELIARRFVARDWARAGGELVLMERWIEGDLGWMCNRDLHVGPGGQREVRYEHRQYSGAEARDLLASCGFREVRLFGDFERAPHDLAAKRPIAVARK